MANKRMFSMDIIDTDKFQDMPISARYLYFELGMRADDDGFMQSPKKLMRTIGCSEDDLLLLVAKGYVWEFGSGVIIIIDWRINNTLKGDRYHPSILPEREQLSLLANKRYLIASLAEPRWNQDGSTLVPQYSIEEVSMDKVSSSIVETSSAGSAQTVDNSSVVPPKYASLPGGEAKERFFANLGKEL